MRALAFAAVLLSGCSLIVGPTIDPGATGGGGGGGAVGGGGGGDGGSTGGGGGTTFTNCDGGPRIGLDCKVVPLATTATPSGLRLAVNDQGFIALANEAATQKLAVYRIDFDGGSTTLDEFSAGGSPTTTALGAAGSHYVVAWTIESSSVASSFSCRLDQGSVTPVDVPAHFDPHGPSISVAVDSSGQVVATTAGNAPNQNTEPSIAVNGSGCPSTLAEQSVSPFVALGVTALQSPVGPLVAATGQGLSNEGYLWLDRPNNGTVQFSPQFSAPASSSHSAISGSWLLTAFTSGSNDVQLGWILADASTNWNAPADWLHGVAQWSLAGASNGRFALGYTAPGQRLTVQMVNVSAGQASPGGSYDLSCAVDSQVVDTAANANLLAVASLSNGTANVYLCPVPSN